MPNAAGCAPTTGSRLTVELAMSADPLVLRDDMRIDTAARLLVEHGYTGAPVIDGQGRLSGVLHALDVALTHLPLLDGNHHARGTRGIGVRDVLRPAVTIAPARSIAEAAERMRERGTDRLVVVTCDQIVGVVTGQDLLWAVVMLGDLVRAAVDERIAAMGVTTVSADVDEAGVVLLLGRVDSLRERDKLVRAIGAIGGVTEVEGLITIGAGPRSDAPGSAGW